MDIGRFRSFLAYSVIGSVTLMPLLVLPAMVGVLVDNAGMSDSSAGLSTSVNFLAGAIVGLLLSVRIHHIDLRKMCRVVLLVAIAADVASAFTAGDSIVFFATRVGAGLALGAAYVASVASFARQDEYERGFGIFVTLQFIISGLGLYIVPVYADVLGAKGLFLLFAASDFIAFSLVGNMPSGVVATKEKDGKSEFAVLLKYSAILAIVGFAVFETANNAQFAFIERFGVALSISDHQIGMALLLGSLIGIPGAFCIVLVGGRFGTLSPLLLGISIGITGMTVLFFANDYGAYLFGSCCMGFSWAFSLPFIQSLLASIDRKGSAIAAGSSFATFGSALGPGVASVIVIGGKYTNIFLFSISVFVVAIILFVLADHMRKQSR